MPTPAKNNIKYELAGLCLLAFSILTIASFVATQAVGEIGQFLSYIFNIAAGNGKFLIPILLGYIGIYLMLKRNLKLTLREAGLFILLITFLIHLHLASPAPTIESALEGDGGGVLGALPAYVLLPSFGRIGTYIILFTLALTGIVFVTGISFIEIIKKFFRFTVSCSKWLVNYIYPVEDETHTKKKKDKEGKKTGKKNVSKKSNGKKTVPAKMTSKDKPSDSNEEENRPADAAPSGEENYNFDSSPVNNNNFCLPPTSLLNAPGNEKTDDTDLQEQSQLLEQILANFGIKAEVINVSVGPAITRYEIKPPPGIKVSKISALADDIALGMASSGVRIEAPIPKRAAVGIEVPNPDVNPVHLRKLLESKKFAGSTKLSVALGEDITGNPIIADLGKMPHLLIAGATGAGKSVCVNTLICSILFNATPDDVKFILIDPKMVELANYNGIPHLVSPVVTEPKKAAGALRWVVKEMERRYELFASSGARDITRYNQLCKEYKEQSELRQQTREENIKQQNNGNDYQDSPSNTENNFIVDFSSEDNEGQVKNEEPLPYIVVIIDELSDLMMVAPGDVEDAICRLAQMARACGIHLVVATQRPSVDVITGLIKANIPSRISFAVSSQTDSRTILDTGGAEKLLGKGDMLFFPVGAPKPLRAQGAFVSDSEVESVVEYLKQQAQPEYNEEVLTEQPQDSNEEKNEDWDELLPQAAQLFIESGNASISMLQRRLHIGYSRAARLMDIMEQRGIVGGYEGSKPRQVLMNWEEYLQVFGEKQAHAN